MRFTSFSLEKLNKKDHNINLPNYLPTTKKFNAKLIKK